MTDVHVKTFSVSLAHEHSQPRVYKASSHEGAAREWLVDQQYLTQRQLADAAGVLVWVQEHIPAESPLGYYLGGRRPFRVVFSILEVPT